MPRKRSYRNRYLRPEWRAYKAQRKPPKEGLSWNELRKTYHASQAALERVAAQLGIHPTWRTEHHRAPIPWRDAARLVAALDAQRLLTRGQQATRDTLRQALGQDDPA